MKLRSRLDLLVVAGIVVTVGNLGRFAIQRNTATDPERYVSLDSAATVRSHIRTFGGSRLQIGEIAAGRCMYLVVTGPNCSAGAAAAKAWSATIRRQRRRITDESWFVGWISVGDSSESVPVWPPGFEVPVYFADDRSLAGEIGASAFPVHLVFDRSGRLVASDVGAPLPLPSQLQADCVVLPNEIAAKQGSEP